MFLYLTRVGNLGMSLCVFHVLVTLEFPVSSSLTQLRDSFEVKTYTFCEFRASFCSKLHLSVTYILYKYLKDIFVLYAYK